MRRISIGRQNFERFRVNDDDVTLITRPRRFGKTLNLSMMECFFSVAYAGRDSLFEGLSIWEEEAYRSLQGTFPVIALSFADIKGSTFKAAREEIILSLMELFKKHSYLLQGDTLTDLEKRDFYTLGQHIGNDKDAKQELSEAAISRAVMTLMSYMERYYGKKVIVLLDEYDTPLQEAYVNGYWKQLTALLRSIFNSTFKTNDYRCRAI